MTNGNVFIDCVTPFKKDVYLWGDIGEVADYKDLVKLLDESDQEDTITIYINSWGGVFTTVLTLLKSMIFSKAKIVTVIDLAASAAALLALAGDEIRFTKLSSLMLHFFKRDGLITTSRDEHENKLLLEMFKCIFKEEFAEDLLKSLEEKDELWFTGDEIESLIVPFLNNKDRNERLQYSSVSTRRSA